MTPAIRVRARSPRGHCRCGVRHPPTPTLHPPGAFSPEQVDVLLNDPALVVDVVGELAMGALTGSEIATVMADVLFPNGGVLTGWEAHAPNPPPAAAPEDGADGGAEQPDEAAPPSVDEPPPAPAVDQAVADAPTRAPARKAKGA